MNKMRIIGPIIYNRLTEGKICGIIITLNQLNMLKKSFFVSKGVLYPSFGFLHTDLIKMQIPLVESRLALLYSSWFSDSGFAFFVRWLRSAHFLFYLCKGEDKCTVRNAEQKSMKAINFVLHVEQE